MNDLIKEASTTLSSATSSAAMARWLREIVSMIESNNTDTQTSLIQEVQNALERFVSKKLATVRAQPDRNPWHIATGTEANVIYLLHELKRDCEVHDPKIRLVTLEFIAAKLETSNGSRSNTLDRAKEILAYCESEFACIAKSPYDLGVMVFPDIDTGCSVECPVLDADTFTLIVNVKASHLSLVETFSYEAAALIIAFDGVPDAVVDLLSQTTSPDVDLLGDNELFWEYLMAVKLGLSFNGPYGYMVSSTLDEKMYAKLWNEFLRRR